MPKQTSLKEYSLKGRGREIANQDQDGVQNRERSISRDKRTRKEAGFPSTDDNTDEASKTTDISETCVKSGNSLDKVSDEVFSDIDTSLKPFSENQLQQIQSLLDTQSEKIMTTMIDKMSSNIEKMISKIVDAKIETHMSELKNNNKQLETENKKLNDKLIALEKTCNTLGEQCNHNDQYSRKNSVRVLGIQESGVNATSETEPANREDCAGLVVEKVNSLMPDHCKVRLNVDDIEVAHRVYARNGPRPVLVKFKFRASKDVLMRQMKRHLYKTSIKVFDDLSPTNRKLLWQVNQHPDVDQAWSSNGKIMAKVRSGQVGQINITDSIEDQLRAISV